MWKSEPSNAVRQGKAWQKAIQLKPQMHEPWAFLKFGTCGRWELGKGRDFQNMVSYELWGWVLVKQVLVLLAKTVSGLL